MQWVGDLSPFGGGLRGRIIRLKVALRDFSLQVSRCFDVAIAEYVPGVTVVGLRISGFRLQVTLRGCCC